MDGCGLKGLARERYGYEASERAHQGQELVEIGCKTVLGQQGSGMGQQGSGMGQQGSGVEQQGSGMEQQGSGI